MFPSLSTTLARHLAATALSTVAAMAASASWAQDYQCTAPPSETRPYDRSTEGTHSLVGPGAGARDKNTGKTTAQRHDDRRASQVQRSRQNAAGHKGSGATESAPQGSIRGSGGLGGADGKSTGQ
jgi:hypothetical protein